MDIIDSIVVLSLDTRKDIKNEIQKTFEVLKADMENKRMTITMSKEDIGLMFEYYKNDPKKFYRPSDRILMIDDIVCLYVDSGSKVGLIPIDTSDNLSEMALRVLETSLIDWTITRKE